ncbi:MAG: hypothetical protein AB7V32_00410 [Candidatus Berkiella sp.]
MMQPKGAATVTTQNGVARAFTDAMNTKSSLPVTHNRFVVDKGAREIQILLTTDDFKSIELLSPMGKIIIPFQGKENNVSWQKIDKLYAIKVQAPFAGLWQIQGNLQSYPEVIVTSSLDIVTPVFPNNLIRGETLALSVYLEEDGKKLTQGEILDSTQMTATLQNIATSDTYKIYLNEDDKSGLKSAKGLFSFDYRLNNIPGVYRLDILVTGLLFQRERHQQFYLHDYPATLQTIVDAQNDEMQVKAKLTSSMLDAPTCQLSAVFQNVDGSAQTILLDRKGADTWMLRVPASPDITRMSVVLAGYLKDARPVQIAFPDVNISPIYHQAYDELEQNQLLKSNQAWQRLQTQAIEAIIPFSISKQMEQYLNDANLFDEPAVKPLNNYRTPLQSLLEQWVPKLFASQEELWMNRFSADATGQKTEISKKQRKSKLEKAKIANAKAKAQKIAQAKLAQKKKWMLVIFAVACLIFIAVAIGVVWYIIAPFKRKSIDAPLNEKAPMQESEQSAQEKTESVEKEVPKASQAQTSDQVTTPDKAQKEQSNQETNAPDTTTTAEQEATQAPAPKASLEPAKEETKVQEVNVSDESTAAQEPPMQAPSAVDAPGSEQQTASLDIAQEDNQESEPQATEQKQETTKEDALAPDNAQEIPPPDSKTSNPSQPNQSSS